MTTFIITSHTSTTSHIAPTFSTSFTTIATIDIIAIIIIITADLNRELSVCWALPYASFYSHYLISSLQPWVGGNVISLILLTRTMRLGDAANWPTSHSY